jgi:hypothetical protein
MESIIINQKKLCVELFNAFTAGRLVYSDVVHYREVEPAISPNHLSWQVQQFRFMMEEQEILMPFFSFPIKRDNVHLRAESGDIIEYLSKQWWDFQYEWQQHVARSTFNHVPKVEEKVELGSGDEIEEGTDYVYKHLLPENTKVIKGSYTRYYEADKIPADDKDVLCDLTREKKIYRVGWYDHDEKKWMFHDQNHGVKDLSKLVWTKIN